MQSVIFTNVYILKKQRWVYLHVQQNTIQNQCIKNTHLLN